MEAGPGQRRELVAPGIPALREAVTEDDERTHTLLSDVHAHTIRLDNAMLYLAHHDLQGGLYPTCLTSSPYCDSTTFLPKDTAYGGSSLRCAIYPCPPAAQEQNKVATRGCKQSQ